MKLKTIELKLKNKIIKLPQNGEFGDGVNIIYSDDNNKGKTTLIRSIIKSFFSESLVLPIPNDDIGQAEFMIINFIHQNKKFRLSSDFINQVTLLENENEKYSFDNKNDLMRHLYHNFPMQSEVRASIIATSIFLDQDHEFDDPALWPSLWSHKEHLQKARYWLFSGAININFKTFKTTLNSLKVELKTLNSQIDLLQQLQNSDVTENYKEDLEKLELEIKEAKIRRNEYLKIFNDISNTKSEIFNLKTLTKSWNRQTVKNDEMVYVSGIDLKTNEDIMVKINLDRLINFTEEPIKEISDGANLKISNLEKKLTALTLAAKEKSNLILNRRKYFKLPSISFEELIAKKENINNRITTEENRKKEFNESQIILKKNIKLMNQKLLELSQKDREIFSSFNSDSGSDKFATKLANFTSFISTIKNFNFPCFIDSFKEKDFSFLNQFKLLAKLEGISLSNKKQIFVTATNPSSKILQKYDSYKITED